MKKKIYTRAPLPFMGQKRQFIDGIINYVEKYGKA